MPTFVAAMRSHKQIIAWQVARELTVAVHRWVDGHWTPPRSSALEQLRRASLSVRLNIVEGYACGPGPRCRNHLRIAFGSAVECTEILEFLSELGADTQLLIELSRRVQALTLRLMQRS
jgi:four helix bundle protein